MLPDEASSPGPRRPLAVSGHCVDQSGDRRKCRPCSALRDDWRKVPWVEQLSVRRLYRIHHRVVWRGPGETHQWQVSIAGGQWSL